MKRLTALITLVLAMVVFMPMASADLLTDYDNLIPSFTLPADMGDGLAAACGNECHDAAAWCADEPGDPGAAGCPDNSTDTLAVTPAAVWLYSRHAFAGTSGRTLQAANMAWHRQHRQHC